MYSQFSGLFIFYVECDAGIVKIINLLFVVYPGCGVIVPHVNVLLVHYEPGTIFGFTRCYLF